MKKLIIAAAVVLTGLFVTAPEAEAGPRFSISIGSGGGYSNHGYSRGYGHGHSCAPYIIRTSEINRSCRRVVSHYLRCGRPVYRHLTIVTYRSYYSNGSCRTFTRSFYS